MRAVFADAAGIRGGDDVRVAGVQGGPGRQGAAPTGTHGNVDRRVHGQPAASSSAPRPRPRSRWRRCSAPSSSASPGRCARRTWRTCPRTGGSSRVERTKTPFDVFELTKVGTRIDRGDRHREAQQAHHASWPTSPRASRRRSATCSTASPACRPPSTSATPSCASLLDRADTLSATWPRRTRPSSACIDQSQAVLDLRRQPQGRHRAGAPAATDAVEELLPGIVSRPQGQLDMHPRARCTRRSTSSTAAQATSTARSAWLGQRRPGPGQGVVARPVGRTSTSATSGSSIVVPAGHRAGANPVAVHVRRSRRARSCRSSWRAVLALRACSSGGGGYRGHRLLRRGVSLYASVDVKVLGLPAGRSPTSR